MSKLDLPKNAILAAKVIDSNAKSAEKGMIGHVFGVKAEKPGNIAALIATIFTLMLGLVLVFGADGVNFTKKDQCAALLSIITLTLGFLFGHSQAKE